MNENKNIFLASISYDFGPDGGLMTYTFPEGRQPDMNNDLLALGFISSKSNCLLFHVDSGTSSDYLQLKMVINSHLVYRKILNKLKDRYYFNRIRKI